jgi:uncharacterized phage protein (TIGR02218 family)
MNNALLAHLKTGSTTVCRAWMLRRRDGQVLGFTDHDEDLEFEGVTFAARTGLTARALQQSTGLSVDNSEAAGALSDAAVREQDIFAGRYDAAEIIAYQVNWENVQERTVLFRGSFGEITRAEGAFRVELRGLTEVLNRSVGHVFHSECSAVLGDARCGVDLLTPAFSVEKVLRSTEAGRFLVFEPLSQFAAGWFIGGRVFRSLATGPEPFGTIKQDRLVGGTHVIELWQSFVEAPEANSVFWLQAGCDKRATTCRSKFANFLNFRGFPHIPGEDWLRAAPSVTGRG